MKAEILAAPFFIENELACLSWANEPMNDYLAIPQKLELYKSPGLVTMFIRRFAHQTIYSAWLTHQQFIIAFFLKRDKAQDQTSIREVLFQVSTLFEYKAQVLSMDISFAKGEVFSVLDASAPWWEVCKPDGTTGFIPSNYVEIIAKIMQ